MSAPESLLAALDRLPPLRDVIARHDLAPKKALGQNFLLDLNLTGRIARQVPDIGAQVIVEVGPGPGGLTRAALAAGARQVIAIEKDQRCLAALAELAAASEGRLRVIEGDALTVDVTRLAQRPYVLSNLPYNIATPLTVGWLAQIHADPTALAGMTLMYQREVVDRLTAEAGGKSYGRLSVLAQWLCRVEHCFDVPARAFTPPPKVTSAIARFTPRPQPLFEARLDDLEQVTAAAFGQRRKMLRASLKTLGLERSGSDSLTLLSAAGIEPTDRAEVVDLAGFGRLVAAYARLSRPASDAAGRRDPA